MSLFSDLKAIADNLGAGKDSTIPNASEGLQKMVDQVRKILFGHTKEEQEQAQKVLEELNRRAREEKQKEGEKWTDKQLLMAVGAGLLFLIYLVRGKR